MNQGGNFWTLFTPGIWKLLHAVLQAKAFGYDTLAITDHNTLAGIARAHARAKEAGLRLVVGVRLDLRDGLPVLAYPLNRTGYSQLCRLITLGKGRAGKEGCDLAWGDIAAGGADLLLILLPDEADDDLLKTLQRLCGAFAGRCYVALTRRLRPGDQVRMRQITVTGASEPPSGTGW